MTEVNFTPNFVHLTEHPQIKFSIFALYCEHCGQTRRLYTTSNPQLGLEEFTAHHKNCSPVKKPAEPT